MGIGGNKKELLQRSSFCFKRLCFGWYFCRCFAFKHQLQQNWCEDSGTDDHNDDRCEKSWWHQVHSDTLVSDNQRYLAAANHTAADLDSLFIVIIAKLGTQSAADKLGKQGHSYDGYCKQQHMCVHGRYRYFDADVGKEDRRQ